MGRGRYALSAFEPIRKLLAEGATPSAVARALGITPSWVCQVRARLIAAGVHIAGPRRPREREEFDGGAACPRCGLRGAHECLTSASISWQAEAARG